MPHGALSSGTRAPIPQRLHPYGFLDYEDGVREEYNHVPDPLFYEARGRFLRGFLAREALYVTREGASRYEARARENLTALLASPRYTRG